MAPHHPPRRPPYGWSDWDRYKRHEGWDPTLDWDNELSDELWLLVLANLSLMQLRMLKTVSSKLANRCRRVLRSHEWQRWGHNIYAMEEEVSCKMTQSYSLPMTVRFFPEQLFDVDDACIGTIHRLKLKLVRNRRNDPSRAPVDSHLRGNWHDSNLGTHGKFSIHVVDMLIEVHGRGICGSEYALRSVLADAVREKTTYDHKDVHDQEYDESELAKNVCDTQFEQEFFPGTKVPSCFGVAEGSDIGEERDFWWLCSLIRPVVDVGGPQIWMEHRLGPGQRDMPPYYVDLQLLVKECPGLLT